MNFKKNENKVRKGLPLRSAIRHSSPIMDAVTWKEKNMAGKTSQIRLDLDRSGKTSANRSSNSSDVSLPGQTLHTDSGISSSDSLAGYDKRFSSSDGPEMVTDIMKMVDDKLSQLKMENGATSKNNDDSFEEVKQSLLNSTKFPGDNIVLPLRDANLSLECNPPSSTSVFMTAIDSNPNSPDSCNHLHAWLDEECAQLNTTSASNHPSTANFDSSDSRLSCSLCSEPCKDPRLLPCLHTFCINCLEKRLQDISYNDDSMVHSGSDSASLTPDRLLNCPKCNTEAKLTLEGVHSLPVNHLLQRLIALQNFQTGDIKDFMCDLCSDSSPVVGRCVQCESNLCHFCSEAHKRQRHTASHSILPAQGASGGLEGLPSQGRSFPMMCQRHTDEQLKLYCTDCSQLVCRDCCLSAKHKDHRCEYVSSVINQNVLEIRNEFQMCEPKIPAVRQAISSLATSEQSIKATANEISEKVERHIASYIRALERHRERLLASIKQRAANKKESVRSQILHLEKIQNDLVSSCEFTSQLLGMGTHSEILSLKPTVVQRLKELSKVQTNESTSPAGEFVEFRANKKVKVWIEGDDAKSLTRNKRSSKYLRPGLEVDICGDLVSHIVEPKFCTAHGEGVHCSRVKLPSEFTVIAKNSVREKLENGGDDVTVSLTMDGNSNDFVKKPKVQIADRHDGTYRVLYVVHGSGCYTLQVKMNGEEIHGSPFTVNAVDSKSKVHTGIFHCCCFCSSGGDMSSTCACGSVMPGGYHGCGHGHEGHPGTAHWSCCGKQAEASSCSKPTPSHLDRVHLTPTPNVPPMVPKISPRSYATLPARGNFSRKLDRPNSMEDQMYASSSTLRSQTRGNFDPKAYFAKQQTRPSPHFSSGQPVKTVSL